MRQSKLFTRTRKEIPKDETSFNAQILIKAGFIDKLTAGVYTFLPLGLRVHENIIKIIRQEMNAIDGQEISMPALTPKDIWQQTDRWDSFDALFRLKGVDDKEYALGATHEEVITPLARNFLFSYKDLPSYIYQIQTKFRNELRAKAGLMRGREFSMKDLYSFHADMGDLDKYYEDVIVAYFKIFKRVGLEDLTYLTYASGGAFSEYSHEFQTLSEAGEDLIYICDKCKVAINKEILAKQKNKCPECGNEELREEKAIETGNIFKLGSRFSKDFEMYYTNKDGKKKEVIMGCYGLGSSRAMGAVVEVCHDEKGIIWPKEVAPFLVHLVSLNKNDEADRFYAKLQKQNIEVLYDDRQDTSAGEKFSDADLIGCPFRIVVSEKTSKENKVEMKKRNEKEAVLMEEKKILDYLQSNK